MEAYVDINICDIREVLGHFICLL